MPTYDANIQRAFTSQRTLINESEHSDPEQLATIGRAQGHQVRVRRNENEYALYTVSETRQETPGTIIRMARVGRARLTPDGSEIPDDLPPSSIRRYPIPPIRMTKPKQIANSSSVSPMTVPTPDWWRSLPTAGRSND